MKIIPRLILMISIVITLTDIIEYIHLKQHPDHLTVSFLVGVILITIIPIVIILWFWHQRKLL